MMILKFASVSFLVAAFVPAPLGAQQVDTVQLAEIRVIGTAAELSRIPGAATLVPSSALQIWRAPTPNEVLRQVPGLTIREEEGLGLRPNIGVRGLNPTRSTKVLLLEDGIPITFAPYGDNASYYHPPITRFERVEVLRGSGQIAFGPQTVGGVINYITPTIPAQKTGRISLTGGSRSFLDVNARGTARVGPIGGLATFSRRWAEGARENIGSELNDAMVKATASAGANNTITVRGNYYRERSNVTYSGLTEAEWDVDPYYNPFRNDSMKLDRWGGSATHALSLARTADITTTVYGSVVQRHWWRQSSNSTQRPNDSSDPLCGGMTNLDTTCGNEGRLRSYVHYGIEPRVRARYAMLGVSSELEAGVRWHTERQDRVQVNGASPIAREAGPTTNRNSGMSEDNLRENTAWSGFLQQRMVFDHLSITPGLRLEHIKYDRTNRRSNVSGRTDLTQVIPGIGATYEVGPRLLFFAGAHRGFAPPRTEDIIDNSTGAAIDLDAELSWNYEVGMRGRASAFALELTAFRLNFENQIVPASVAGGSGATLTNAGRTLHQGLEIGLRVDGERLISIDGPYVHASFTWIPTARFDGARYVFVGSAGSDVVGKVYAEQNSTRTREQIGINGTRLPYAPELTYTVATGWQKDDRYDFRVERYAVGAQFGDALNTQVLVADGQQGPIEGYAIWSVSGSHRIGGVGTRLFLRVQNLTNELYIADRTRGLLPGNPRGVQLGVIQIL